jgi:hypothetical protein
MSGEWKAPETLRGTAFLAPASFGRARSLRLHAGLGPRRSPPAPALLKFAGHRPRPRPPAHTSTTASSSSPRTAAMVPGRVDARLEHELSAAAHGAEAVGEVEASPRPRGRLNSAQRSGRRHEATRPPGPSVPRPGGRPPSGSGAPAGAFRVSVSSSSGPSHMRVEREKPRIVVGLLEDGRGPRGRPPRAHGPSRRTGTPGRGIAEGAGCISCCSLNGGEWRRAIGAPPRGPAVRRASELPHHGAPGQAGAEGCGQHLHPGLDRARPRRASSSATGMEAELMFP